MPGRKFRPRHRCLVCSKRGRIPVRISSHVHRRWFCGSVCLATYKQNNPGRIVERIG